MRTPRFAPCPDCHERQLMLMFTPPVCLNCGPSRLLSALMAQMLETMHDWRMGYPKHIRERR